METAVLVPTRQMAPRVPRQHAATQVLVNKAERAVARARITTEEISHGSLNPQIRLQMELYPVNAILRTKIPLIKLSLARTVPQKAHRVRPILQELYPARAGRSTVATTAATVPELSFARTVRTMLRANTTVV